MFRQQFEILGFRVEGRWIDAVIDEFYPIARDAPGRDVIVESSRIHDDATGASIEPPLKRFERSEDRSFAELPEFDDRFRPEVSNLENEGTAFQLRNDCPGYTDEELRTGCDDDVGLIGSKRRENRRESEDQVVGDALQESGIGGEVHPCSDDVNPIDRFFLNPFIFKTIEDLTARMVRYARDDGDIVTVEDPAPAMFMRSIGGRVDFGWEVVRNE